MLTLVVAFFALQAGAANTARAAGAHIASGSIDSVVATAERRFFAQWTSAWKASEKERHGFFPVEIYFHRVHCHPDLSGMPPLGAPLIRSGRSWFSVCPTWIEEVNGGDERVGIDSALTAHQRSPIVAARALLLALLDSAVTGAPRNDFVVGQRIRFLIDQGATDRALSAVQQCHATLWWCAALAGYVHVSRSEMVAADSAFAASMRARAIADRCRWLDLGSLLPDADRRKYEGSSCALRDSMNASLLWLADPLFSEPGNERRVEQYSRQLLLALRTALGQDERFDWRFKVGSDARAQMVLRYGWPSQVFWPGPETDWNHTRYLDAIDQRRHYGPSPPNEPYTSYEYTRQRTSLIPSLRLALDPLHSLAQDWSIATYPLRSDQTGKPSLAWPTEHFVLPYEIVPLTRSQTVFLRRQTNVLFAAAADLNPDEIGWRSTETINVTLVMTSHPDSVERVATARGTVGAPVVLRGFIDPRPAVAGIEFSASGKSRPAGRARFGITPPAPLSAMKPDERAISNPVLLQAPSEGEILPQADSALQRMAGSPRVQNVGRVGVYWETYGFKPTDTVEVAVWIERHTGQGIFRRFGIAFNVTTDLNTPVAITWTETQLGHSAYVTDGPVPIIGRSVVLDVTKLLKGDYYLDVAVRARGKEPVRGRTSFTVQ